MYDAPDGLPGNPLLFPKSEYWLFWCSIAYPVFSTGNFIDLAQGMLNDADGHKSGEAGETVKVGSAL